MFFKYDGGLHRRLTMRLLGEDEHGTWLYAAAGTTVRSGVAGKSFTNRRATVRLVPAGQWWSAIFFARPGKWDVYCDIGTPARWPDPGTVSMVDLDLDLLRARRSGRVQLLDEDEFTAHSRQYDYPAEVVAQARDAAGRLMTDLTGGAEPFATRYRHWLQAGRA